MVPPTPATPSITLPLISIILTNHNGLPWLGPCLDSIYQQPYQDFEVIFVDNHSHDESVAFVRTQYPEVSIIENGHDEGFAQGNNIGLARATGDYILLLNIDTKISATLLSDLMDAFRDIPHLGVVQPKLFFMYDTSKLDSCGSKFSFTGFLEHIGNQQDASLPRFNHPFPVFSAKGSCMMFPRHLLQKTSGLFDEDYYCYFEETDFCLRVWLTGYECWYYPAASIQHAMGGVTGKEPTPYIQYHSFKNRLTTYLKNFSFWTLVRLLPTYLLANVAVSLSFIATGKAGNFLAVYRALWYNAVHLPRTLRKRYRVQRHVRTVRDSVFLHRVTGSIGAHQMWRFVVYLFTYERGKDKMRL